MKNADENTFTVIGTIIDIHERISRSGNTYHLIHVKTGEVMVPLRSFKTPAGLSIGERIHAEGLIRSTSDGYPQLRLRTLERIERIHNREPPYI